MITMKTKFGREISKIEASTYTNSWARCLTGEIPDLFSSFNEEKQIPQRVFMYELSTNLVKRRLLEELLPEGSTCPEFRIHMACNPDLPKDRINNEPRFFPILTVRYPQKTYFFALEWNRGFVMTDQIPNNFRGFQAKIHSRTLHELVYGWCICKHYDLSSPFEGLKDYVQQRVMHYNFNDDSQAIFSDITKMLVPNGGFGFIRLFMGLGHPHHGDDHLYQFRPILQIGEEQGEPLNDSNDENTSQYEFSTPCPPCQ